MAEVEQMLFTVGVFADRAWAERGIEALKRGGFPAESLSILAKETPETAQLIAQATRREAQTIQVKGLGALSATGDLLEALGGPGGMTETTLAAAFRRVGFQAHDGRIFETLTSRGGVLVAVQSLGRSADALALLHSHGAGNAAIGAWSGRV